MDASSQYDRMPNDNQTNLVFPDIDQTFQTTIRLPLPLVYGNKDYRNREKLLQRMAEIIVTSGVESAFVTDALEREHAADVNQQVPFKDRRGDGVQQHARRGIGSYSHRRHASVPQHALDCGVTHFDSERFSDRALGLSQ